MSFDADPIYNERNAFYKGLYQQVIDDASSKSEGKALVLRAKVELDSAAAAQELKSSKDELSRVACSLALHKSGKIKEALKIADSLISSEDAEVKLIVATTLARESDRVDEAIDLLSSIDNSLEAVALLIQIHLATNQLQQAQTTLKAAKSWAQDAELIQLADAWVALRNGAEGYQSAFYTFQEFADSNGAPPRMMLAQAVSEIELGHYDEAQSTLSQVLAKSPDDADALANMIALCALTAKDAQEYIDKLKSVEPSHPAAVLYAEKTAEFETLKGNYTFVSV